MPTNKVTYASLKLKPKTDVKEIIYNDIKIEVLQYLPIEDKYDLIMITLQKAKENGFYNQLKLSMYMELHMIYMYTNIIFTEKQKDNESRLYDCLDSNGIINAVISAIPESEYEFIMDTLASYIKDELEFNKTVGAVIGKVIQDLPTQAAAVKDIIDNFDKDKFAEVVNFARAANGGRDIKTNQPIVPDDLQPALAPM